MERGKQLKWILLPLPLFSTFVNVYWLRFVNLGNLRLKQQMILDSLNQSLLATIKNWLVFKFYLTLYIWTGTYTKHKKKYRSWIISRSNHDKFNARHFICIWTIKGSNEGNKLNYIQRNINMIRDNQKIDKQWHVKPWKVLIIGLPVERTLIFPPKLH